MVEFAGFRLDPDDERLWKGDKQLSLRRKPFAILRYLVANPKRLVTHQELIEHVWAGTVVSESSMRSHLHELRQVLGEGLIETVIGRGYRFTADVAAPQHPSRASAPRAAERGIVGRAKELAALHAKLDEAHRGQRQLCFVTGDPGIGKTTLVDSFVDEVEGRSDTLVMRGSAIEQHGTPEAYLPIIEMVSSLRQSRHHDRALATLLKFAPAFLAQVPHLVPDGKLDEVTQRARGAGDSKPVRELLDALEALALDQTVVVVLEDVQWSDVATLDLIALLGARRGHSRLLMIATARSAEAQTVSHPLNRVFRTLVARAGATQINVEHIAGEDIQHYLDLRLPGHALPVAFTRTVAAITAGTPLFLVTLIDDLIRRGMLVDKDGTWSLAVSLADVAAHRPDSVRQLVDMQLDRLTTEEQRVLEAGSVAGTDLSPALIAAALEMPLERVDEICDSLARRSLFLRREGVEECASGELQTRYALRHRLVQEVCLERSAPVRRQRWHRLIAEHLERTHGQSTVQSHLLAQHFDQGQVPARAVHYYLRAAEVNEARFASADALKLCRRARELISRLPADRTRDELELAVLGHLAQSSIRVVTPADEPLEMFERMVELARAIGDPAKLAGALINLTYRYATLAKYMRAHDVMAEADAVLSTFTPSPDLAAFAGVTRSVVMLWTGMVADARALMTSLLAAPVAFDPRSPGILGPTDRHGLLISYLSFVRWVTGDLNGALNESRRVLEHASRSGDPFFLGAARCHVARHLVLRNESPSEVRALSAAVVAAPEAAVWHSQSSTMVAWADAHTGTLEADRIVTMLREYRERMARFPLGSTLVSIPMVATLRAGGYHDEARQLVDEMITFSRTTDEVLLQPELLRLRGELREAIDPAAAERDYLDAIASAKHFGAATFELRTANNLATLWLGTPRAAEGRALVAAAVAKMVDAAGSWELARAHELLSA